jgi:hypothetical protein
MIQHYNLVVLAIQHVIPAPVLNLIIAAIVKQGFYMTLPRIAVAKIILMLQLKNVELAIFLANLAQDRTQAIV